MRLERAAAVALGLALLTGLVALVVMLIAAMWVTFR